MVFKLYIILMVYFLIGGVITIFVNKDKDIVYLKNAWLKYFVYLVIINLLFASVLINVIFFQYLCLLILLFGYYEIIKSINLSINYSVGIISLLVFSCFAFMFYNFAHLSPRHLFYTLFLTTVFDAFSQLSGQLLGKRKIFPKISPNKTYAGVWGGLIVVIITSVCIRDLLYLGVTQSILMGIGISGFALSGDLLASYCKRKFKIKDFSNFIPGHGGFLDRFDSLLATGSFIFLIVNIFKI